MSIAIETTPRAPTCTCESCKVGVVSGVYFREEERVRGALTGRYRIACSHLLCDACGEQTIIDGSFDGP